MKLFQTTSYFVAALCLMACAANTPAQTPPALLTNGCGSGTFAFLVPNKTKFVARCEFENACNAHDICYAKCLEGGALEGNSTCNIQDDKRRRRQVCDVSLQTDIINGNPGKQVCSMYASVYRFAVQLAGENYFKGLAGAAASNAALSAFMSYVEKRPDVFDMAEVELAFERLAIEGVLGTDYVVMFSQSTPELQVWKQGSLAFSVKGREGKQ